MVRHAPIHRRSGHSDIAICCGRNVRGSSPSTSVVPLSNQVTTLNHKRFKGFKMFSDGNLEIVNSFCCANLVARERKHLASDLFSFSLFLLFRFGFLNWVRCKPVGPRRWKGADGSRSLCASSTHARNPAMGPEC